MGTNGNRIASIAEEIALYLAQHPEAADSLKGVQQWWLARQRFEDAKQQVQSALEYLEEHGIVVKVVLPDGTVLYKKTPEREKP